MTKLFKYQRDDLATMAALEGRVLLANEPGLGKSLTALSYVNDHRLWPAVIVCPASLKYNWELEVQKHLGRASTVLEGRKPDRALVAAEKRHLIVNYDVLDAWLDLLLERRPACVVLDEAHYCKSRSARRTKAARILARSAGHVLALSGTPMVNRPADLWPVLNILRPDLWPSWWAYAQGHCAPKRTRFGWDFSGASNLGKLHRDLQAVMIRRRKEDVLADLPPKVRGTVPLPLSDVRQYRRAQDDFLGWLRRERPERVAGAERSEGLSKAGYLLQLAARLKRDAVLEWCDDFLEQTGRKLITFGVHVEEVGAVRAHYGDRAVLVNGSVTGRARQEAFDAFNNDPKVRVFVGNIAAAGQGWSCTSASDVAFFEMSWVPGHHTQAEDRCHGVSRGVVGCSVGITYLVGHDTIDEKLCRIVQSKQHDLSLAIDGGLGDPLDVYNLLAEELKKERAR